MCVHVCVHMRVHVCVCVFVGMYVHMYVCMYVCLYVSMHTCIKSISDDLPHHIFLTAQFPRGLKCIYYPHNIHILFKIYVLNLYCINNSSSFLRALWQWKCVKVDEYSLWELTSFWSRGFLSGAVIVVSVEQRSLSLRSISSVAFLKAILISCLACRSAATFWLS